jgi:hypothetical protein
MHESNLLLNTSSRLQVLHIEQTKQTPVAFSPQANYTAWATANRQRILVPTFADREESRGQRGGFPRPLISGF